MVEDLAELLVALLQHGLLLANVLEALLCKCELIHQ